MAAHRLGFFIAAAALFTASPSLESAPTTTIYAEPHRLTTAATCQNLNSVWSNHTKQNGILWGGALGYEYTPQSWFYAGGDLSYLSGTARGSAGNDFTEEYGAEARAGVDLSETPGLLSNLFVGLGWVSFDQNISHSSKFRSYFWTLPVGLNVSYEVASFCKVGIRGAVSPMFAGRWHISKWKKTKNWFLWRIEAPITFTSSFKRSAFDASFVPYVREWAYRSKGGLIGQKNIYVGIKGVLGYHF